MEILWLQGGNATIGLFYIGSLIPSEEINPICKIEIWLSYEPNLKYVYIHDKN